MGGIGITPLHGLSEVWTAPKGMAFGPFMSENGVNFVHIGLKYSVFFTRPWLGIEDFVYNQYSSTLRPGSGM